MGDEKGVMRAQLRSLGRWALGEAVDGPGAGDRVRAEEIARLGPSWGARVEPVRCARHRGRRGRVGACPECRGLG